MQQGELVSVIIPTFNRSRSIRRAVDGVLAQTWKTLELIVVDDGSTDSTLDILGAIDDPRLRVIRHDRNGGAGRARHTGVLAARGDLVAFQDSDDAWLPDKLERQVRHLEELGGNYVATFCPEIIWGRDGEGSNKVYGPRRVACVPGPRLKITSGDISGLLMRGNFITLQTLLVRREAYHSAGGFDLSLPNNEDWDFNLRLSRQGPIGFLDTPLVIVSDSPDGLSKNRAANTASMVRIYGKLRRHDPANLALAPLAFEISRFLMAAGKPKQSLRYLRRAIALEPRRGGLYLRYALSHTPGLYRRLIERKRRSMRVT